MPEPHKSITLAIVIGLLKHFTETIVGKDTVSVIFDTLADTTQDTVNGLLGEITGKNEQLRQVLEACQRAEGCFEAACTREELWHLSGITTGFLPSTSDKVQSEIIHLTEQSDFTSLLTTLTAEFAKAAPNREPSVHQQMAALYLDCLKRHLAGLEPFSQLTQVWDLLDVKKLVSGIDAVTQETLQRVKNMEAVIAGVGRSTYQTYTPEPLPNLDILQPPGIIPPGSPGFHPLNQHFTGREKALITLAKALLNHQQPVLVTQAIHGLGGIGKTQLAVQFAHCYGRFFAGVHWLDASQPLGLPQEIVKQGRAMGITPWPENDQETQIRLTLQAWQTNGPRLVVLDNLEDPAQVREWLSVLQQGGDLRILITSRRSDLPPELVNCVKLDVFTPTEGISFLRKWLPDEILYPEADLQQLGERLGYLPLALLLAGRYLNRTRKKVDEFLAEITNLYQHPAMLNWRNKQGENPTNHDMDLYATFLVSWEQLTGEETAQNLLIACSWLAPNHLLPEDVLSDVLKIDSEQLIEAFLSLADLGLVQEENGFSLHPLVAEFGRGGVENTFLEAVAESLETIGGSVVNDGYPQAFEPYLPHYLTLSQNQSLGNEKKAWLLNNLGRYHQMFGTYDQAKTELEQALYLMEASFGKEDQRAAPIVNNLGSVLQDLGDYPAAKAAYQRALEIDEVVYGPNHPDVARDVNNLGGVLHALGDYPAAKAAYERALEIDETVYGPNHPDVAIDVNNLGGVLQDLGDYPAAKAAYERALEIGETVYGPNHPMVATFANNLGLVLKDLGDYPAAKAVCERALKIDETVYGPNHPNVAIRVNNLGEVLRTLGDYPAAKAAFERALKIDETVYGPHHPMVATIVNNLGGVLDALGDYPAAKAAYERALKIDETVYGPNHPDVARAVNNLGMVLQALGDYPAAKAAYQRALVIFKKVLPADHPNIKIVQENLDSLEKS